MSPTRHLFAGLLHLLLTKLVLKGETGFHPAPPARKMTTDDDATGRNRGAAVDPTNLSVNNHQTQLADVASIAVTLLPDPDTARGPIPP